MPSEMPERPVQHDVKAASMRAFSSVVPARWRLQERDEDYGIDYDAEIFRDGAATGLGFAVQLKGKKRVKGSPSTRVKWRTWNYWSAHDGPVLVVLWDEKTRTFWWMWTHRFDPTGLDRDKEKFTFKFLPHQTWDAETPARIEADVESWRAWDQPADHLPISVIVSGRQRVSGVDAGKVIADLRRRLARFGDLLQVRTTPSGQLWMSVELGATESKVWFAGGPSNTLHHADANLVSSIGGESTFIRTFTAASGTAREASVAQVGLGQRSEVPGVLRLRRSLFT